jgi:tRNA threonylcarbamoyladenosine biosynthesis protein TsaB
MRVLALDTTTRGGSVAFVDREQVLVRRGDDTRSHAERLPGDLLTILAEVGRTLADVDLFAITSGPGSFTGLRIGIATIQGLAFVTGKPVAAVSALEALGHVAAETCAAGTIVGAWMDAFRGEVFSALYRVSAEPAPHLRLEQIEEPTAADPAATRDRWRGSLPAIVAGDGAIVYRAMLEPSVQVLAAPALAGIIGQIGASRAAAGLVTDPAAIRPLYVRRPDAVVARERREQSALRE